MSPKTADKLGIKVDVANSNQNFSDLPNTDVGPRKLTLPIPDVDPMTAFPMAEITLPDGRSMQLPVMVAPGQADATLSIALGWGRTAPRLTKAGSRRGHGRRCAWPKAPASMPTCCARRPRPALSPA